MAKRFKCNNCSICVDRMENPNEEGTDQVTISEIDMRAVNPYLRIEGGKLKSLIPYYFDKSIVFNIDKGEMLELIFEPRRGYYKTCLLVTINTNGDISSEPLYSLI